MKLPLLASLVASLYSASVLAAPQDYQSDASKSPRHYLAKRQSNLPPGCQNSATSRGCWGDFNIDTNWYNDGPNTGKTVEVFLDVVQTRLAPDGYERQVLTFNGTIPGPAIIANWGDTIKVHVTNKSPVNGTAIHWHGLRQVGTMDADGVPGVTQCPSKPGSIQTYTFKATQYGTTWYHSHFTLQYADGLLGPIIINGPATEDYTEDLGTATLMDWGHKDSFFLWNQTAHNGGVPAMDSFLINGTNVATCSSTDPNCKGAGKRFELPAFTKGNKYRLRLINTGIDGVVRFTIDNHKFKVIANDLVPIVPYETTSVNIAIGQRYDIVITADQEIGNYWLRAVWQQTCARNTNLASDQLGVIRYVGATDGDPTTTKWSGLPDNCQDESPSNLKPHVPIDVGSLVSQNVLKLGTARSPEGFFQWTVNSSSLVLDWENPTALKLLNGDNVFPTPYNVYNVPQKNQWVYWAIQNSGPAINHPIHLHGHDFQVLASAESSTFVPGVTPLNTANPVRRDVATLPKGGYLVIGFFTDNPGSWLIHCHIAWHASQGLSLQFVERQDEIVGTSIKNPNGLKSQCADWGSWYNSPASVFKQDDSGI